MVSPEQYEHRVERIEPRYFGIGELFFRIRDAVVVGNAETGRVVLWNETAAKLFGYTAEEATSLRIEDLVPDHLKQAHRQGLERFARTGHGRLVDTGTPVELPAVRKDGSEVFVELSLTPLESDRVAGRYALAIIRDVTERKETLEQLRRLDDLKNTFIATVAHDIRSPMAAVLGFAEFLREREEISESDRQRILAAITRSASNVTRLVDDVLLVAALESGEVPYEMREIDLLGPIEHALDEVRAANPELTFVVRAEPGAATAWADPDRLWQVLANLLSNAARVSPAGGVVEVIVERHDDAIQVSVVDQGPGIGIEEQEKLFKAFSRLSQPPRGTSRGTGLGLYICRCIVEAHGGTIRVASEAGSGSSFIFTIPAEP
jgi:PAS domain S-box-containing protein